MTKNKKNSSKVMAFWRLSRLNRTVMAAVITGSAAFAAGAGVARSLWMTLAGWCLAVGGFSLDAFIHREREKENQGAIAPAVTIVFALVFIAASIVVTFLVEPWALIPCGIILILVLGTALPVLAKPLAYTFILGLLHAFHLIMGSTAGSINLASVLLAVVLLFAIVGARGIIDIRNFPKDLMTRKQTLPKRLGMTVTVKLSLVCFLIAYALGVGVYFGGNFSLFYLIPVGILIITGLVCIYLFVKRAGPDMARKLTPFFTSVTVLLVCLAMILGSL